ncbi:hypothetical protein Tco_0867644 [Tanacetum coccineum]
MTTLKFADTHNMVVFLAKLAESEGFGQIVDFLNAHTIKYALMINPIIYTSCIEQFWATVKAKTVNREVQLQALVDGKKIIITESTVRRDLLLEDAEGVDCLPNVTIFEQLTLMRVGKGFFGRVTPLFPTMVVHNQEEMDKGLAMPIDPHHTPTIIQPSTSQPQKTQKLRRPKRKDTEIPQSGSPIEHVVDEAVYKELDDSLVRAATTASSLEAEQDSGNIHKTQSKAAPNEPSFPGTSSGGGPRRQETMGDTVAQTRVESSRDEESFGEDASKQGRRITDIDDDEDITLVNDQIDADVEMFDVDTLTGDEVLAKQVVAAKDVNLSVDEVTLAQALVALKSAKVQEKGDVIKEPSVPVSTVTASIKDSAATTTTAIIPTPRKGIVFQKPKDLKTMEGKKPKDQPKLNKEKSSFKRVNTFVDFRTDLVEDEEEVALDAIPLAVKSLSIVDWKIHKEGKKIYYQIYRVVGRVV